MGLVSYKLFDTHRTINTNNGQFLGLPSSDDSSTLGRRDIPAMRGAPYDDRGVYQIPSDLVVKSQATDIIGLIFTAHRAQTQRPQAMSPQEIKGCGALNICSPVGYHSMRWSVEFSTTYVVQY